MAGILKVDTIQNANADNIITQTNSTTLTIGASGDTVTLAAGATSSGFGRSGTVNWDTTKKTTGFTAVNGVGYFCDTTSSAFTATLPLSPSAGAIVAFSDYTGTWITNNLTVGRNGSNINGAANNLILNTSNTTATLIYVDATEGWRVIDTGSLSEVDSTKYIIATGGTITTCGDFKIHTFTGPGTFTVSCAGNSGGSNSVDYLVVAGGGSGTFSGGGGAGGFRQSFPNPATAGLPVTAQAYPITVGSGGGGTSTACCAGSIGNSGNSSIFSTITSAGGGYGGVASPSSPAATTGANGGSGGGGGAFRSPGGGRNGGTGNTPPVAPSQGNPGGKGSFDGPTHTAGGGGGGAGAAGSAAPAGCGPLSPAPGGAGGAGTGIAINPSPTVGTPGPSAPLRYFAGGGGGGSNNITTPTGGVGGGGAGNTTSPSGSGTSGTINTGGGGGGNGQGPATGGSGGSGIVVIRYKFQ
jgi:hypothetical protein